MPPTVRFRSNQPLWRSGAFSGALLPASLAALTAFLVVDLAAFPAAAQDADADDQTDSDCDNGHLAALVDTVLAVRVTEAIAVDGRLDEGAWQRPSAAPLVQNDPDNGCPPRQLTDWWVAYDDSHLYVAARCWDTAPDSIVGRLVRRDDWTRSDWVYLNLDTYNDDRNGYSFSVNAAGSIQDAVLYNDGWDDQTWDAVWTSAARIDAQGWTVEIAIPFSQVNFPAAAEQTWGINFSRRLMRYNERDEIFHRPRGASGYIRRFPDLVGITGIQPKRALELLPYAVWKSEYLEVDPEDPYHSGQEQEWKGGLDLKYGLASNLNLTATINPDFGQVEVDPAVVNLSDFETFFEEKRPFFVKDANIFRFGSEGTNSNWSFNWSNPHLFYSRRIGRHPQVSLPDHDYAARRAQTTILGAAKVSGKVSAFDVGVMTALTAEEKVAYQLGDESGESVVEPLSSYSVVRAKKTLAEGSHGFGFQLTNTVRDLPTQRVMDELVRSAVTGGVDGWVTLDSAKVWALRGYLSGSYLSGTASAIDAVQTSPVHYFQRPDAPHIRYDPTRTELTGWSGRAMLNKQSGAVTLNTAFGGVSPGYEINDLGFQFRADQLNWHLATGYRWLEPTRTFRYRGFNLAAYKTWDYNGRPDALGAGAFWNVTWTNYWAMGGSFFYNPVRNSYRATRGGPLMRVPSNQEVDFWLDTDSRKMIYLNPWGGYWRQGNAEGGNVGLAIVMRPTDGLEISLEPRFRIYREDAQYVTTVDDATATATYGARYVFSDLAFNQFVLGTRVNWSFTPRMSLQAYMQPLFAVGDYSRLNEFARPGTYDFNVYGEDGVSTIERDDVGDYTVDPDGPEGPAESFTVENPDFNFKSLRVNVVFRWEWRAGSTFYLVWTQDRVDTLRPGRFDLGRDIDNLLEAPGDDILLAKVTLWLDL